MIFQVTMKDPDTLYESIKEVVEKELRKTITDEEEIEMLLESRIQKVKDVCYQWFGFGEYLTVEIDTDKKTCIVLDDKK